MAYRTIDGTFHPDAMDYAERHVDSLGHIEIKRIEIYSRLIKNFPDEIRQEFNKLNFSWTGEAAGLSTFKWSKRERNSSDYIRFNPQPLQQFLGENLVALRCIPFSSTALGEARVGSDIDEGVVITKTPLKESEKDKVIQLLAEQGFRVKRQQDPKKHTDGEIAFFSRSQKSDGEYWSQTYTNGFDLINGELPYFVQLKKIFEDMRLRKLVTTKEDFDDLWFYCTQILPPNLIGEASDIVDRSYFNSLPKRLVQQKTEPLDVRNITSTPEVQVLKFEEGKKIIRNQMLTLGSPLSLILQTYVEVDNRFTAHDNLLIDCRKYGITDSLIKLLGGYYLSQESGLVIKKE